MALSKGILGQLKGDSGAASGERGGSVLVEDKQKPSALTQNFAKGLLGSLGNQGPDNSKNANTGLAPNLGSNLLGKSNTTGTEMIKISKTAKTSDLRKDADKSLRDSQVVSEKKSEKSATPSDPFAMKRKGSRGSLPSASEQSRTLDANALMRRTERMEGSSLADRIGKSLLIQVATQKKELEMVRERAKMLDNPEAQAAFEGIETRAEAALDLKNLEDKQAASDQIRIEGNILMLRFQEAFTNKYLQAKGLKSYGLKDEGNTLSIFRQNITQSLQQYKSSMRPSMGAPVRRSQSEEPI